MKLKLAIFISILLLTITAKAETCSIVTNNNASSGQTLYFLTTINNPENNCNYHLDLYLDNSKQYSFILKVPSDSNSYLVPAGNYSAVTATISRYANDPNLEYMYFSLQIFIRLRSQL